MSESSQENPGLETGAGETATSIKRRKPSQGRSKYNDALWQFYQDSSTKTEKMATCVVKNRVGKECGYRAPRPDGSTSSMTRHLKRIHPEDHAKYLKARAGTISQTAIDESLNDKPDAELQLAKFDYEEERGHPYSRHLKRPKATSLDQYFRQNNIVKFPLDSISQKKHDLDLMTLMARCNLAFEFVDSPGWRE